MEVVGRASRGGAAALTCAVLAIAGCGGSGGNRGESDSAQIRELLADLQAAYIEGDAERYCGSLTASGRRLAARFGRFINRGRSCEELIREGSRVTKRAGVKQKPTRVLAVEVQGDRATATVSDGGRPAQPMIFVKRDGEWKLPDPGFRRAMRAMRSARGGGADPLPKPGRPPGRS